MRGQIYLCPKSLPLSSIYLPNVYIFAQHQMNPYQVLHLVRKSRKTYHGCYALQ
jgi:hypothetical protein